MPRLELRGSFLVEFADELFHAALDLVTNRPDLLERQVLWGRGSSQLSRRTPGGDGADLFAAGGNGDVGQGERGASSLRGTWSLVARSSQLRLSSRA